MGPEKKHKGWNEIKTNDSWAIFKIMGEFVNGCLLYTSDAADE